jgi:hypothetical protein
MAAARRRGLAIAGRGPRIAELTRELLMLELQEECLIRRAHDDDGITITRNGTPSAMALLQLCYHSIPALAAAE